MSCQAPVKTPCTLLGDDEFQGLQETGVFGDAVDDWLTETGSEDLFEEEGE